MLQASQAVPNLLGVSIAGYINMGWGGKVRFELEVHSNRKVIFTEKPRSGLEIGPNVTKEEPNSQCRVLYCVNFTILKNQTAKQAKHIAKQSFGFLSLWGGIIANIYITFLCFYATARIDDLTLLKMF